MNKMKKNHFEDEQVSYWQSYSDMMAALLIIFILIIAITMAIYKQKNEELDSATAKLNKAWNDLEISQENLDLTQSELDDANEFAQMTAKELQAAYEQLSKVKIEVDDAREELRATKSELEDIVGVRTDIIGKLTEQFDDSNMVVDKQNGSIVFSSDVLFKTGSSQLSDKSKDILSESIPKYLGVLMQDEYKDYIAEIIIEGHTDTEGSYDANMNLSYNRANAVAKYCLSDESGLSKYQIEQLRKVMTVNGRSYMNPIYIKGTDKVDMDASRRVEIKFRLKEDEMIEKIQSVLEK